VRLCLPTPYWALMHARAARRPANRSPATARGATSGPGARASPRCGRSPGRAGVGPVGIQAHAHLQSSPSTRRPAQHNTALGVERPHAELHWWRGHGHGALGCGRPAPALTSTCNRKPHGTKAGSQQRITSSRGGSPRGATRRKGEPAHRAGGATRVRRDARRRGAGCSPALPAEVSLDPTLAKALGRRGLG
jgi:hypothetical protein